MCLCAHQERSTMRGKRILKLEPVCLSIIFRRPKINRNFGSLLFLGAIKRGSFGLEFVCLTIYIYIYIYIYSTHCHGSAVIKKQNSRFSKKVKVSELSGYANISVF